jgi:hypothetical protein
MCDHLVRVVFTKPQVRRAHDSTHQYFLWVPLGRLEAGHYDVQLFDSDLAAPTITRHVRVSQAE